MFQKFKDMYKLQKQAKQIKSELKNIHIEAESSGVKVTMTAEQEIVSIEISDEMMRIEKKSSLEKSLKEALQKATKKAQEVAAEKMKGIMGEMGFPAAQ